MPVRNSDLHGSAPDKSETALLIVDVINDLDFPEANQLLHPAEAMARRLAKFKGRVKRAGIPVIYVNDNFAAGVRICHPWSNIVAEAKHARSSTSCVRNMTIILCSSRSIRDFSPQRLR